MSRRTMLAPLAAAFLALAMVTPSAAAPLQPATTSLAPMATTIIVPASWGPQALGWGDLAWFQWSTGTASCLALRRDGWTLLANLPWLQRLVRAAPHPAGSVAARARADLLANWWRFTHDARALIRAGNLCPATLGARARLVRAIVGEPKGSKPPAWATRMFELFAVLYRQPVGASCAALAKNVAWAQRDLASGIAHAKYYGRSAMTTRPTRWKTLLETGATCLVSQGGQMETEVAWGLATLLGAARAEHFGDRRAVAAIRASFQ